MKPVTECVAARMKEPSTWAGLSTVLIAFGVLPDDSSPATTMKTVGVAIGGILATIFPEGLASK